MSLNGLHTASARPTLQPCVSVYLVVWGIQESSFLPFYKEHLKTQTFTGAVTFLFNSSEDLREQYTVLQTSLKIKKKGNKGG